MCSVIQSLSSAGLVTLRMKPCQLWPSTEAVRLGAKGFEAPLIMEFKGPPSIPPPSRKKVQQGFNWALCGPSSGMVGWYRKGYLRSL